MAALNTASVGHPEADAVDKPMFERSSGAALQEAQNMRFSDEQSTAEVLCLIERTRRKPEFVDDEEEVLGSDTETNAGEKHVANLF